MQASQWSALRYFAMTGERARTVVGLAQYQAINPGSASRTIAVLVRRGLLDMVVSPTDKRARIVSLTDAGRALLAQDPLKTVEAAIADMPDAVQTGLATGLRELLDRLFGVDGEGSSGTPVEGGGHGR